MKKTFYALLIMVSAFYAGTTVAMTGDQKWRFTVYLDDDEIGFHEFMYKQSEGVEEITTTANFEVMFLFFSAYSYEHKNTEMWSNNCLQKIDAVTDDNGDMYRVTGERNSEGFSVTVNNDQRRYPFCTKTFSYWDYGIVKEKSLLNSQTGEIVEVEFNFIGDEQVSYQGEKVDARRYRLTGEELQIDLWYSSESNHWLALESITEGGRVVKYSIP